MSKTRLLLADDEEPFVLSAGDYLQDSGFDVTSVSDAAGVIRLGPEVEVLVVDVRLPSSKCEGIEAVGELLRMNRIRPTVPIIFISVELEQSAVSQAALGRVGIPSDRYAWLQKQFELTRLTNVIAGEQKRLGGKGPRQGGRAPAGNGS